MVAEKTVPNTVAIANPVIDRRAHRPLVVGLAIVVHAPLIIPLIPLLPVHPRVARRRVLAKAAMLKVVPVTVVVVPPTDIDTGMTVAIGLVAIRTKVSIVPLVPGTEMTTRYLPPRLRRGAA